MLHWDGWGVAQNRERALHLLQMAAEAGHRTAQHNLGVAYDNGYELVKSHNQAFRYFSLAARQGCRDSMYCLGSFYYLGEGVAQDYAKARYWYRKGAQLGQVESMADLGRCYQRGVGGRRNQRHALFWFTKAVEAGSVRATTWLGLEYTLKPTEDWAKARYWLEQAAEHQQSHAMYLLGIWAAEGWTGDEKIADALFWFEKAVQSGHNRAGLRLAELQGEQF
ncbi:tetratricopeptide repeat protein [Hymenobacter sp. M29]|uniref:Tetratricopeptide repeat protein n=1 Tax=Hymenobacter mellowenesis TaxID=3063995 RepID=A0ABT9AC29_9BACT|nr:tetratricopeptide repeat protein [Hymenobacter sp. M29]MDO7847403.1 tetratricopeptide repeat protein [Hymenobacter sp. M29]